MNYQFDLERWMAMFPLEATNGRYYGDTITSPCHLCNNERLLVSPDLSEAIKTKLRTEHVQLDPFDLKKNIEVKLKNFFTVLGNLNREAT